MIGKLTGVVDMRGPDHVLLDVRGVGYIVHVSDRTLMALPGRGEVAALYTELVYTLSLHDADLTGDRKSTRLNSSQIGVV